MVAAAPARRRQKPGRRVTAAGHSRRYPMLQYGLSREDVTSSTLLRPRAEDAAARARPPTFGSAPANANQSQEEGMNRK